MKSRLIVMIVVTALIVPAWRSKVDATPSSGFVGSTIAKGVIGDFHMMSHSTAPADWHALLRLKGVSDMYVQNNVWAPGGSTGWHSHPGPSLLIVTAGKLTNRTGDDCAGREYQVGTGFVDPGTEPHLIENVGDVEAKTIVVQLIPKGATRRINKEVPEACA